MKKFTRLMFVSAILLIASSSNVWAWSEVEATVVSEPASGGFVYVSSSNSAPGSYTLTTDKSTQTKQGLSTKVTFTFYRFVEAQNGYTFKGWADANNVNSGNSSSSWSLVGKNLTSTTKYTSYAIFARMAADKSAMAYDATKVGQSAQQTITITHAHAGKITANIAGDNAGDFIVSSAIPVANSVSEGTESITVTFAPTCNGTRTATLTLHSDNGLSDVVINLTGEGVLNEQTLAWNDEPINTNLTLGETMNISATATSGLEVVYSSSAPDVVSVERNTLTANKVGTAIITASQAGDCTYSAAESIVKEFVVNDKATPAFWLNNDPEQTEADLKVGEDIVIAVENTDAALSVNADEALSFALGEGVVTVTAVKATENAALTLTQPETSSIFAASRTFTFHITKNTAELNNTIGSDYLVDDEIAFADIYTATNEEVEVTITSSDENVLKVEAGKLVAVGAGTAEITVAQAENDKWTALSATQSVTVSKHANTIVWSFAGEETLNKTLSYDETVSVAYSSGNSDVENSPISITQTAGEDIATYNKEQNTITASYHNGTATWTVSQPEDRKYLAAEATITITVAERTPACYAVEDADTHNIGLWSNSNGIEYILNGVGEILSIDVWKENAATQSVIIYGYDNNGNESQIAKYDVSSLSTSATTKTVDIAETITKIKIQAGGTLDKHFRNLYITRKQVLTPSVSTLTLPDCELEGQTTAAFALTWSSCADEIRIVSNNPKFVVDKTIIPTDGGAGTTDIQVSYSSNELGTEEAVLTLYTPYQQITLPVSVATIKKTQAIVWENELETLAVNSGAVELTASAEGAIEYSSSDDETAYIEGNTLHILKYGSITITATAAETEVYQSAVLSKTIEITPLVPEITTLPTVGTLQVGQTLHESALFGGVATTDGAFAWADDTDTETAYTEAGQYTVYAQFVPANLDWYTVVSPIELTLIVQATPSALEQTDAEALPRKIVRNGQVYILRNNHWYTISGMLLR